MKYSNIREARFVSRPNRFVAHCELDGEDVIVHVKNTGRCRELLIPGCTVFLEWSGNPLRKTPYDLVAVMKGDVLFNIDSSAPNKVCGEWLAGGGLFDDVTLIRPETKFGASRFDFYVEHGGKQAFIEVKGVTLEEDGVLFFPDAPTERGVKHIRELISAKEAGYEAYVLFVIQTEHAEYFTPNRRTHPEFADALIEARERGVEILAISCDVKPGSIAAARPVEIRL